MPGNPHPKTEHLRVSQFQPGKSGNPKGRPQGTIGLTSMLREVLEGSGYIIADGEVLDEHENPTGKLVTVRIKVPKAFALVNTAIHQAAKGDMRAIEFCFDRVEGQAVQRFDGGTTFRVKYFEDDSD